MVECLKGKKILTKGNYAIANAAVLAGCECYFGYPITPQSEIGEFMSGKMQELKRGYVSAESEVAAINMVIGACSTGAKAMTSSSSCAVALMQEGLSYATSDQLPVVLVSVMRGGPGLGNIFPSQGDYFQATKGGGNPTVLLADGLLGQMMEPVEFYEYPYPEIDNSDWALTGAKGRPARKIRSYSPLADNQCVFIEKLYDKYKQIEENETEWEEINTDDADIILTSFGSTSRNVKTAMKICREKGIKAGFFRPITLFPFPHKRYAELSQTAKKFVVVEVNMGQMVNDVRLAVNGNCHVELFNKPVGAPPSVEDIVKKIEGLV